MKIKIFITLCLLIIGGAVGAVIDHHIFASKISQQAIDNNPSDDAHQVRLGGYSLINPLLECEVGGERISQQFVSFKYKIDDEINKLKAQGDVEDMSIYFRDLNNGLGIVVNQTEGFTPASLLKLPVMMAYYKQAETDPSIFKKSYKFTGGQDLDVGEHVKPRQPMVKGQTYTVDDLMYRMIVFSDNNAMALLVQNLPLPIQDRVFTDLGITVPGVRGTEDYMSVADYASFFRILYNASYLNRDNSQKALELLTKVDFADGIRAGMPKNIPVANKFGERKIGDRQQLHDCGIVYFKDHPYLLCIMTRGKDFDKLASSLKDISRLVYTEVQKQTKL